MFYSENVGVVRPQVKKPQMRCILATGITGCGKSTLLDALKAYIDPKGNKPWILRAQMSDIIKWATGLDNELGQSLRDSSYLLTQGKLIPNELVKKAFEAWVTKETPKVHYEHILVMVCGFPRALEQNNLIGEIFEKHCVVHQTASEERARKSVIERYKKTPKEQRREDDAGGEKIFRQKLLEFNQQVFPAIEKLKRDGGNVLDLDREVPLQVRLENVLQYSRQLGHKSPLSGCTIKKAIHRLRTSDHPAHKVVEALLT